MSSYVSEFLINPVLRQARRFSEISRSTFGTDEDVPRTAVSIPIPIPRAGGAGHVDSPPREAALARTLSASTQETIIEDQADGNIEPTVAQTQQLDHLGFPVSPRRRHGPIPEDDGMGVLRLRIQAVNARDIPPAEKARLLHDIILEGYRSHLAASSQPRPSTDSAPAGHTWEPSGSPGPTDAFRFWQSQFLGEAPVTKFTVSEGDIAPTYAPIRHAKTGSTAATPTSSSSTLPDAQPRLGCEHYERNVKLQCSTCQKWYTCRFCHDAREDHALIRKETKHMLCMLCATPQRASDVCINCGEVAAQYYCNICKLWENRPNKPIYHCNDCGICRRGLGLGKDFFHCKTCRACITTSIESSHKCIERSTDCDCPICGEYMFTSPKPVVFMACGHSIHKKCYHQHVKVSYKCPICNKSLANMETQFRNLDAAIENQPMPPEFRDTKAKILCNDCSGRSTVPYHWLGLKCRICQSYNTVELQMIGGNGRSPQESAAAAAAAAVASDAVQTTLSIEPEAVSAARPTPISADARVAGTLSGRRRHSSSIVEPLDRVVDRLARSVPAPSTLMDHSPVSPITDDESDDDILGFWRRGDENESEEYDSEVSGGDEGDDGSEDENEEDDENEIILIGHR